MKNFFDRPFVVPSIFLGVAAIIGLAIVGWGISARGNQNTISVTGSADAQARADEAGWSISLSRTVPEGSVTSASAQMAKDANAVSQYLTDQHLASTTISISPVNTYQNYSSDKSVSNYYSVNASVSISTSDVDAIDSLSHNINALNALVTAGTIVSPNQPQYYISTLPALRVSLLGAAVKDAKARAEQIAESGDTKIGPLETASSGVVQVLAPNSTNVEDYGQYDTSTIEKDVMVTVHADFYVH